ncbi:MFS transporter [Altererythrobacter fulvus]|uniref:MFS transporter n=1 Tax=Caenibius fulvus TaxID=2126012 RepID=UPI0030186C25
MAIAPNAQDLTAGSSDSAGSTQPWPSERAGFFALFAIIFATFITFFDQTVFGMLAEKMKGSFGISDATLGFLLGPASLIAYVIVGIPLARLVDIYPRKYVLSGGIALLGSIMALGGIAQSFAQLVGTRLFVGASSSANGPGSYSLLSDYFRPLRIPLVFALLQLGYIGGSSFGNILGGQMIAWTSTMADRISLLGIEIFSWQLVLIMIGLPGLLAALIFLMVKEPPRRSPAGSAQLVAGDASFGRKFAAFMGWDAAVAIWQRKTVFLPLFAALALSAVESQGLPAWRIPFMARTYGWNEAETGALLGTLLLVAMLAGIFTGGLFVTWMGKRYKDANIRATAIIFACTTVTTIAAPLMPTGELAVAMMALGVFFGLAGAPAQNAAVQRIVPNEMRGQVSALYLFMFTFFGGLGSWVIGSVSTYIVGDEDKIWEAILITALIFLPTATFFMWRGIKPYREEVARLEAEGK